jgi:hypothetical protein
LDPLTLPAASVTAITSLASAITCALASHGWGTPAPCEHFAAGCKLAILLDLDRAVRIFPAMFGLWLIAA